MAATDVDTKALQKTSAETVVLALLEQRMRHGYEIAKLIESRSDTPIAVSFLAERTLFPAFGIQGGKDGAPPGDDFRGAGGFVARFKPIRGVDAFFHRMLQRDKQVITMSMSRRGAATSDDRRGRSSSLR